MSKLGMDQLLNRVIKLEEAITKLAAWTHFSEPLDLGSVASSTRIPPSQLQVGLLSVSSKKCSSANSSSTRPRRSCRKRSPPLTTTATNLKKGRPKRTRSKYTEYDSDQESDSSSDDTDDHTPTGGGDSDSLPVNVKMEIVEEDVFAVLPDSPQQGQEDGSDFSYECEDGESSNQQIPSKSDTRITPTRNNTSLQDDDDDDVETPGLLVFPSLSLRPCNTHYVAYRGFLYTFNSESSNKQIFRCHQRIRSNCRGRIHLTLNLKKVLLSQESDTFHTHPAEQDFVDAKYFKFKMQHLAVIKNKPVAEIVAEEVPKMSEASRKYLPSLSTIQRTLERQVQRSVLANSSAPSTKNLQSRGDIPDEFCTQFKSSNGETFIRWDSAVHSSSPSSKNDRFLICCTQGNLDFLAGCDLWLLDGGFKCSPPLFDQLLVIYGVKTWISKGAGLPLIYCLLPNRNEESYGSLISSLQSIRPLSAPHCILSDYNATIRNALITALPNTSHGGNFFHFADAIYNHIRNDDPLYMQVSTASDFQLHIWQLISLAFVPVEDVQNTFHQFETSAFFQVHAGLFQHFFQYFKSTWLGVWDANKGQMVPPQFPIQHWNCYESVFQKSSPKMNTTSKNYHSTFLSSLTLQRPTLYKFIECLLRSQTKTDGKLALFNANQPDKSAPKKNLLQIESNLKKLVQAYPQRTDVFSYLNGIAYFLIKNAL